MYTIRVVPTHRTPARVLENYRRSNNGGAKVFITITGLAAHLPGVVASHTTKPVIGVPVNAAILAARIMAAEDQELA